MTVSKKNIQYLFYFILTFYFIYTPEFFLAYGIPIKSQMVTYMASGIIILKIIFHKILNRKMHIVWEKNEYLFLLGIILSAIYFELVALFNYENTRFLQNTYILFQVMVLLFIFSRLDLIGLNREKKLFFIFNITLVQSFFVMLSLIFPTMKNLSLKLYYLGRPENIFISKMRIFGISGDYTFFTPIFHGLLISVAVYLVMFEKKKKFLFFIPFLILSTIVNGRTGIYIAIINIIIMCLIYLIVNFTKFYKIILASSGIVTLLIFFLFIISLISKPTYDWFVQSFTDLKRLFLDGEKEGTIEILSDMIYFPEGWKLIFGEGFRLYGNRDGGVNSDIGYVNDLFMGGIIYCTILYTTIINYIFKFKSKKIGSVSKITISLVFLTTIVIGNFKGEASRSGLILLGIVILKFLIDDADEERKLVR
ncbi:MAG: hypothetical protein RR494_02425 [Vagococcus sp.]|uniref:hypothetical protein n=1 Tax=Vagococcus sp. TaxID=1933889 RepID=UPI002FC949F0